MGINFTTNIVGGSLVAAPINGDANYAAPGNFALAANQIDGAGEIRLMNLVEVVRSYINDCGGRSEAYTARALLTRMIVSLHNGGSTEASNAQTSAMQSFRAAWRNTTI